ncbi:MAG: sodium-dependent transporter [Xenococcaceae cyanobacterium MO_188.B29]|nr:sodium-dependent transporter [Xenococcaceae cyanobacterium MO_188.B29]
MIDQETRTVSNHWQSPLGFVAAAAGSAVGLGNIWKFPYMTGQNGGGTFVLFYLLSIVMLGFPIMVAEVMVGKISQSSPVRAYSRLSNHSRLWQALGFVGVMTGFIILSYYSVVGGWTLHYLFLSVARELPQDSQPQAYADLFGSLYQSVRLNIWWHSVFMGITILIVLRGVRSGIEWVGKWGMLALLVLLVGLAIYSSTLPGFSTALEFVFGHSENFTWTSALEALGHAFFSLSLGMGAMLTYGSYLQRRDKVLTTSLAIAIADTFIAIGACLVLFPITFSVGLEPAAGPGLVFINIPLALLQLPFGYIGSILFFLLLSLAALTSAISLLEVPTAFLIDSLGWSRRLAATVCGGIIYLLGFPSAVSGGEGFWGEGLKQTLGMNWFDSADYLTTNWLLPLGGIGISLFVGWRITAEQRKTELGSIPWLYSILVLLLRWFVPIAIVFVMLHALKVL